MISAIGGFRNRLRILGWRNTILSSADKLRGKAELRPLLKRPSFHVRSIGSGSDFAVCRQIFDDHEYRYSPPRDVKTIVDAGANIGCASIYFAENFEGARIIAIEASPDNFEVLQRNTSPFPKIECLNAALWDQNARLMICGRGQGAWALYVAEIENDTCEGEIEAITLPEVRARYGLNEIDILKIDIEGGERNVFMAGSNLLEGVNVLIVETHDRWVPGCTRAVYEATRTFDYEWTNGENIFFCREGWLPQDVDMSKVHKIQTCC